MDTVLFSVLLAMLCLTIPTITGNEVKSKWLTNERTLYEDLMVDYQQYVRPAAHENDTVSVEFGMALVAVEDLDESIQVLSTHAWLRMKWVDVQLSWDPALYGGVKQINIPIDQLWSPDIMLYNAQTSTYEYTENAMAVVLSSGTVFWIPPIHLRSRCNLDLSRFPFDQHTCTLKFGSWTYHDQQINLTTFGQNPEVDSSGFTEHAEWEMIETRTERKADKYACCPQAYPSITYYLTFKRRPTYLTHLFVAPSVVIALIIPTIFLLPPDSGEKIILGVGLLVGQTLLLEQLEDFLPSAHPTVPLLGLYYLVIFILVCFALLMAAAVINIWNRSKGKTPMPGLVRTFVLGIMSRVFCVNRDDYMPHEDNLDMRQLEVTGGQDSLPADSDDKERIMRSAARLTASAEWRQLAVILDRLCAIVFLVIVIIMTVSIIR